MTGADDTTGAESALPFAAIGSPPLVWGPVPFDASAGVDPFVASVRCRLAAGGDDSGEGGMLILLVTVHQVQFHIYGHLQLRNSLWA